MAIKSFQKPEKNRNIVPRAKIFLESFSGGQICINTRMAVQVQSSKVTNINLFYCLLFQKNVCWYFLSKTIAMIISPNIFKMRREIKVPSWESRDWKTTPTTSPMQLDAGRWQAETVLTHGSLRSTVALNYIRATIIQSSSLMTSLAPHPLP